MWRLSGGVSRRFTRQKPAGGVLSGTLINDGRFCSSKTSDGSKQPNVSTSKPTTPPPPPPPPEEKSGGVFFKLLGLTLVGTGGIIGYAWYDEKFRSQIEQRVPYSKEAFGYVFKSLPSSQQPTPERSDTLAASPEEIKQFSLAKKKENPPIEETKAVPDTVPDAAVKEEPVSKKEDVDVVKREEKKEEKAPEDEKDEKELDRATENAALENILAAILAEAESAVVVAVELQTAATTATRDHTKRLRQLMDSDDEDTDSQWVAAITAFTGKSGTLAQAESAAESAGLQLEKLRSVIKDGRNNDVTKTNSVLWESEQKLHKLTSKLNKAVVENTRAQGEARVVSEYRDMLQKGREQFKRELESFSSADKGGKLTEEELNSLIAHAHRRIEQLQRHLEELQKGEQKRLEAALEKQRQLDETLAEERIKQEHEIMKASFERIADQWALDQRVEFELEMRQQLSRQAAAHSDHLTSLLKVSEKKLTENFEKILDDSLYEQKLQFERDITGWIGKLKGFESALEARAETREKLRKSQELWLACERLHTIVKNGPDSTEMLLMSDDDDDGDDDRTKMKPLLDEFIAVLDAGADHPFVNSVLESVPDTALHRGICTERELRERFKKVCRVCRRVALLDEGGGTLYQYIVSYLQSLFVARVPLTHSDRVDPTELNVFTILDYANYHLERGDLETALRFMNQLTGEPRKVASDWIKEARLLLETKQVADALLAHASADGLGSLF